VLLNKYPKALSASLCVELIARVTETAVETSSSVAVEQLESVSNADSQLGQVTVIKSGVRN